MTCLACNEINERDYPLCKSCETKRHFTHPKGFSCRCVSCVGGDPLPAAKSARFAGMVLIATSDDPPEMVRVKLSLAALKPECRLPVARAWSDIIKSLVKQAA